MHRVKDGVWTRPDLSDWPPAADYLRRLQEEEERRGGVSST